MDIVCAGTVLLVMFSLFAFCVPTFAVVAGYAAIAAEILWVQDYQQMLNAADPYPWYGSWLSNNVLVGSIVLFQLLAGGIVFLRNRRHGVSALRSTGLAGFESLALVWLAVLAICVIDVNWHQQLIMRLLALRRGI